MGEKFLAKLKQYAEPTKIHAEIASELLNDTLSDNYEDRIKYIALALDEAYARGAKGEKQASKGTT